MLCPREKGAIVIDITNACPRRCSNCTRFTGHVREPFFMNEDQFIAAAEALRDFPTNSPTQVFGGRKSVVIIGGEPQTHYQFERISNLFAEYGPPEQRHRSLYTAMPIDTSKYRDTIYSVFGYVNENLHADVCKHQPLLVAIEDVIPDRSKMWNLIEQCWVNHLWSATINPWGFWFCEVAAGLAQLYGEPEGLPVSSEVWQYDLDHYLRQIEKWCTKCGAAIPMRGRVDYEELDDVSLSHLTWLTEKDSPGLGRLKLYNHKEEEFIQDLETWQPYRYLGIDKSRPTRCILPSDNGGK